MSVGVFSGGASFKKHQTSSSSDVAKDVTSEKRPKHFPLEDEEEDGLESEPMLLPNYQPAVFLDSQLPPVQLPLAASSIQHHHQHQQHSKKVDKVKKEQIETMDVDDDVVVGGKAKDKDKDKGNATNAAELFTDTVRFCYYIIVMSFIYLKKCAPIAHVHRPWLKMASCSFSSQTACQSMLAPQS